jgi:toxin ParE1/3/4
MKPVRVHPDAEAEIDRAFEWLWVRSESAALDFDTELRNAFGILRKNPRACAPYLHGTRRVLLHRYSYFVVFREFPRKIEIVAVAHSKRKPGYWSKRV